MERRQSLPLLWLLSDERNDTALEDALAALPSGSGFVFRHYHLPDADRRARFAELRTLARARGHLVIVSHGADGWDADGCYGWARSRSRPAGPGHLWLATAHDGAELARANALGADGVFLSPVYPTRSHPGAPVVGPMGFHVLAQQSAIPVIALGGMTRERAAELGWPRWGAIDGLHSTMDA